MSVQKIHIHPYIQMDSMDLKMYDSSKVYHIGKHGKNIVQFLDSPFGGFCGFPQDLNKKPTPTGRHWKTGVFFGKKLEHGPQVLAQQELPRNICTKKSTVEVQAKIPKLPVLESISRFLWFLFYGNLPPKK